MRWRALLLWSHLSLHQIIPLLPKLIKHQIIKFRNPSRGFYSTFFFMLPSTTIGYFIIISFAFIRHLVALLWLEELTKLELTARAQECYD